MISTEITAKDICTVTQYSRHQLRGLLKELPGFDDPLEDSGRTRIFSRHELLILAICCQIESVFGVNRKVLRTLVGPIRVALSVPRDIATRDVRLLIAFSPPSVEYLDSKDGRRIVDVAGLIFPLHEVFVRVDSHINPQSGSTHRSLDVRPVVGLSTMTRS